MSKDAKHIMEGKDIRDLLGENQGFPFLKYFKNDSDKDAPVPRGTPSGYIGSIPLDFGDPFDNAELNIY